LASVHARLAVLDPALFILSDFGEKDFFSIVGHTLLLSLFHEESEKHVTVAQT
jgi:hypothetical protein